jgi:D-glycero-D-manno-heptose 1,7-bisphosphate phosphatase
MAIKTIFLDRDGVINKEVGYLHKIEDFIFIDGVFEACLSFKKLDYQIIIISNQSGIARGYFTLFDYENLTKWMLNQFSKKNISILDVFFCPHGPKSKCSCRKPMPGMLIGARDKFNIDMKKSWLIGDKESDIEAANRSGIKKTILVRSGHLINENITKSSEVVDSIRESTNIITS